MEESSISRGLEYNRIVKEKSEEEAVDELFDLDEEYDLINFKLPLVKEDRYAKKFKLMRKNCMNGNSVKLGLTRELMLKMVLAYNETKSLNINNTDKIIEINVAAIENKKRQNDSENPQAFHAFLKKQYSEWSNKSNDSSKSSVCEVEETVNNKRSRTLSNSEDLPAAKKKTLHD